ncbi:MAG: 3-dehydroquinate synthase [Proteobacteria bacterium]|nr:3-dehydroquinate synthase [Pseudomonadota bacterium]
MSDAVNVDLGARSYDVLIGQGLLARVGELIAPFAKTKRVFIVTDQNVARLHRPALVATLDAAGLKNWTITLPPGEGSKSFSGLEMLTRHLLQAGVERSDLIIAFGGGVIGDLAGLAAGIVKRGLDFAQIPTTLLAQVDSSVGGKTAIDTPEGKNLIGLFHQPRLVIADTGVLQTLPERELRAGYAEIVKIGLINDAPFFEWCEANAAAFLAQAPAAQAPRQHAIRHAVAAKAAIVAADEREAGQRALLNLGHTFAHALEAHSAYDGALLHGEAVAAGMSLAFHYSAKLGLAPRTDADRVTAHLTAAGFITDLRKLPGAPFDAQALAKLMAADKKNESAALTLILVRGIGQAFVQKRADEISLLAFLEEQTHV